VSVDTECDGEGLLAGPGCDPVDNGCLEVAVSSSADVNELDAVLSKFVVVESSVRYPAFVENRSPGSIRFTDAAISTSYGYRNCEHEVEDRKDKKDLTCWSFTLYYLRIPAIDRTWKEARGSSMGGTVPLVLCDSDEIKLPLKALRTTVFYHG